MKELEYPFDSEYLLKKKRAVRKALLAEAGPFTEKKIAVLGGSTTPRWGNVIPSTRATATA